MRLGLSSRSRQERATVGKRKVGGGSELVEDGSRPCRCPGVEFVLGAQLAVGPAGDFVLSHEFGDGGARHTKNRCGPSDREVKDGGALFDGEAPSTVRKGRQV